MGRQQQYLLEIQWFPHCFS